MLSRLKADFRIRYIIVLVLGAIAYLFFYYYRQEASALLYCPFKLIYQIPCPACGITRATDLILQGEVLQGILLNPLVVVTHLGLFSIAIWLVVDVFRNRETFLPAMRKRWCPIYYIPILMLLALNMWWNIKKGL